VEEVLKHLEAGGDYLAAVASKMSKKDIDERKDQAPCGVSDP
jgi:hypothetical protein